ncbi:MAG: formylglycine-generating enzyme family protein [Kofleriaceae bacterium]
MSDRARLAWGVVAAGAILAAAGDVRGEPPTATSDVRGEPPTATAVRGRPPVALPAGELVPFFAPRAAAGRDGAPAAGAEADAPRRPVPVAAFALDATPVTNAEFATFLASAPRWRRSRVARAFAEEGYLARWAGELELGGAAATSPVTHVSWFAAQAFCRARRGALPTTLQWEYALEDRGRDAAARQALQLEWFAQPSTQAPGPVAQRAPNGYGVYDLVGLVWEWTLDFGADSLGGESRNSGTRDEALVCGAGSLGARDPGDYATFMRYAFRASLRAAFTTSTLGFRCAYPIAPAPAAAPRPSRGPHQ